MYNIHNEFTNVHVNNVACFGHLIRTATVVCDADKRGGGRGGLKLDRLVILAFV